MSQTRLNCCVLLPFAAGYYLSYLFRSINALIAGDLAAELHLSAGDLGLLTSVYFLVFAAVQLPLGALLDRHGPATIQAMLLLFASAGALVFALSDGLLGLLIGRALLGLGVAVALMAGFKAIVIWFPPGRVALANGTLVMLGALGAVTATAPAECLVHAIGWRGLFVALAGLSALVALLVLLAVPEPIAHGPSGTPPAASLRVIYQDPRFWRIAPLSAAGIGTSWSLQGLWAAPWLRDVDGLDRAGIVAHLGVMAIAVCVTALLLGILADKLRRRGLKTEGVLAVTLAASMAAQAALALRWPVPSCLAWAVIAAAGAATVLGFAILTQYFPKTMSGRANAALNLLHISSAFILQSASGFIIGQWPQTGGTYPATAHQAAMAAALALQLAGLARFVLSPLYRRLPAAVRVAGRHLRGAHARQTTAAALLPMRFPTAGLARRAPMELMRGQVLGWRLAAAASATLCIGLTVAVSMTIGRPAVAVLVFDAASAGPRSMAGSTAESMPGSMLGRMPTRMAEGAVPARTKELVQRVPEGIETPVPEPVVGAATPANR